MDARQIRACMLCAPYATLGMHEQHSHFLDGRVFLKGIHCSVPHSTLHTAFAILVLASFSFDEISTILVIAHVYCRYPDLGSILCSNNGKRDDYQRILPSKYSYRCGVEWCYGRLKHFLRLELSEALDLTQTMTYGTCEYATISIPMGKG